MNRFLWRELDKDIAICENCYAEIRLASDILKNTEVLEEHKCGEKDE